MKIASGLFLMGLTLSSVAWTAPAQILLIRHGEKPKQGDHLSPQGWQRAAVLPTLFHNRPEFQVSGTPAALYAMGPSREDEMSFYGTSVRAIETLQYVSQDLGLPIISHHVRDDYASLVNEILSQPAYNGRLVVICWQHRVMTSIAAALRISPAPVYPKDRFDRAWLITLNPNGTSSMVDLPEKLLPGDSPF